MAKTTELEAARAALAELERQIADYDGKVRTADQALASPATDGDFPALMVQTEKLTIERAAAQRMVAGLRAQLPARQMAVKTIEDAEKRAKVATLKGEAERNIKQAVDALLKVQLLCEEHMRIMGEVQALAGASSGTDRRGANLWNVLNSQLQMAQPGRFYPIDQRGKLADRERGG